MGFLESFLDALGRSELLPDASGTLLDDRGGLKHYACNGLEASSQAYATQGTPQQLPEPSPQNIQIQQDYYSYKRTRIISLVISGASTRFEAQGLGGLSKYVSK